MSTLLKVAKIAKANLLTKLLITEPIRNSNVFNIKSFKKKYILNEVLFKDRQVLTITKDESINKHIIFLHGGSYTDEAILPHRIFVERLVDKYDVKVTYIDYPLTPEYDYKYIHKYTLDAILDLMKRYENDTFYFIGDSAGGGLVLSMLQSLKKLNIKITKSVLLSPWLDVSMSNPDIRYQLDKDFTLDYTSLIEYGMRFSGDYPTTGKEVSPMYGDLDDIGDFLIYTTDNELLYPDIIKFNEMLSNSKGNSSKLIIESNLCHDYPLLIIKETKNTLNEIIDFLN